ncbi:MAG: hypothetical protein ACKVU4_01440 [Phycisphaerales bacterium]
MTPDPDQFSRPSVPHPRLSPDDAAALDALLSAGYDPGHVPPAHRERSRRAHGLLGLLSAGALSQDGALADATLARVRRAADRAGGHAEPVLTPADGDALDSWIMHDHAAERVAPSLRVRARRLEALSRLVTGGPVAAGDRSIVDATLARVQVEIDRVRAAFDITAVRARGRGLRFADLVGVAATLLIGGAVVWPVLGAARDYNRKLVCQSHLGATATALASYAGSFRDSLPTATASLGGGRWWDVGCEDGCANSANLYSLVRGGFASVEQLSCPGNPHACTKINHQTARDWRSLEEVSYSMQLVYGPQGRAWITAAPSPVLADRSPVVLAAVRGQPIDPFANSPNHGGRGQCVLYTDGSVRWYRSPVLPNGDNIWLPRPVENRIEEIGRRLPAGSLSGRELPDGADDTVLGP